MEEAGDCSYPLQELCPRPQSVHAMHSVKLEAHRHNASISPKAE